MIVIARNFGQLGNRLFLASHLLAAARHYGVPLLNPSFADYAHYFPQTAGDLWCRYDEHVRELHDDSPATIPINPKPLSLWKRKALYKAVYLTGRSLSHLRLTGGPLHVIRIGHAGHCDLLDPVVAKKIRSRRPLLVAGWRFDSGGLLREHADAIRRYFEIAPQHRMRVRQVINRCRERFDHVVGIHIRHGDYANFLGGRYFYPTSRYVETMRAIQAEHRGRRVGFLICGNGQMNPVDFAGLPFEFGTGHLVEDMYAFAACDQLVGPPSTFTGWASFYGDVPLRHLQPTSEAEGQRLPESAWPSHVAATMVAA
ncbi:MAG: hypothetical protein AAF664_15840 [Planctomycetota bacterium]